MSTLPEPRWDVLVVGAGPAGLAAAACCAEAGLRTLLADDALQRPWPNNYGGWVDELTLPETCMAARWSAPLVLSDAGTRVLDRAYAQLDNERLKGWLVDRLAAAGGETIGERVVALDSDSRGVRARFERGGALARVAIDATGARGALLQPRRAAAPLAWQTAYGVLAEVEAHPWAPGQMVLMDLRSAPGIPPQPPSFLYAMPFDDRRVFLEETVLAARPAFPVAALAERLERRLAALQLPLRRTLGAEEVRIPMDTPLPRTPQAVVGFGAAGGFIHPATGYSVARSLRAAPALASALAAGLAGGDPARASALAWAAIQPVSLRRSQRLARSGLEALLAMDAAALGAFMDGFFEMPQRCWSAFLSGTAPPGAVLGAMVQLGLHLPADLLARVALTATSDGGGDLLGGLVPGWERYVS
jgi:lycopene beta-cyclase